MRLEDIDKNFATPQYDKNDIEWYDVKKEPFSVYGVFEEDDDFVRMPEKVAKEVNEGVHIMYKCSAGGRVRFSTDSPIIAIYAEVPNMYASPSLGMHGFDVYCDEGADKGFVGASLPDLYNKRVNGLINVSGRKWEKGMHYFTVNMPLYSQARKLFIGVKKGSKVDKGKPYNEKLPIVYYGSSITQGASASRPGMCYENIIVRRNEIDYINLGFSGNAKGEETMANYIADLKMGAFVYDYDYNAPTSAHLKATHEPFFTIIRKKHPDIPVIMLTKPCTNIDDYNNRECRDIIKQTYLNAKANGDNNVYFIDGSKIFKGEYAKECTYEYCHPTDVGFIFMADDIYSVLKEVYN